MTTTVRIVSIFEIANNKLCPKFLSSNLSVTRLLFIVVKPRAKRKFVYFTLHKTLISPSSVGLVNNNMSLPI
jgi:hypothetical protein